MKKSEKLEFLMEIDHFFFIDGNIVVYFECGKKWPFGYVVVSFKN